MKKYIAFAALALSLLAIPVSSADAGVFHRSYCRPVYRTHYRTYAPRVCVAPVCVQPAPVIIQSPVVYPSCVPVRCP